MDTHVVKIQFGDSLRRLSLEGGDLAFSYAQLVSRTKDVFQVPATAQLVFTYTDRDGDVVNMAEDQDLRDALVTQGLNPLRLHLAVVSGETKTTDVKMNDAEVKHGERSETNVDKAGHETEQIVIEDNEGKGAAATPAAAPKKQRIARRNSDTRASAEQVVHKGIACDDCGMAPIAGTRYKSITEEDYDLCRDCFEKPEVVRNTYLKIKRGRPDRRSVHFARGFEHGSGSESDRLRHRHDIRKKECSGRACENGRREKRSGEAVHYGVVCDECKTTPIVGPRFKSEKILDYDLCQNCFQRNAGTSSSSSDYTRIVHPLHHESLYMSMPRYYRFVSPFSLYRYSPYGRPFLGRRIHRIEVTTVSHEEEEDNDAGKRAAANERDAPPAPPTAKEVPAASMDVKMSEQEDRTGAKADNLETPSNQPEIVVGAGDFSMTEDTGKGEDSEMNTTKFTTEAAAPGVTEEDVPTHDGNLAKLASLGFNDSELNEEHLRKNNFDVQSTLDDLTAAKNWDPMLEELQEMGFYDSDLNRRLLAQSHGNVKHVVKELVRLTKEVTN